MSEFPHTETTVMLSNKTYDYVKKLVQVVLPALASLYFGLSQIWGLPAAEEVVGTIALITTFLGVVLGISHNAYENSDAAHQGVIVTDSDEGGLKGASLELHVDPDELPNMKSVSFKVQHGPS